MKEKSKNASMRTARDVIKRFFWDASLDRHRVLVGYLDRVAGGLVERALDDFFLGDISTVGGPEILAIPQHRIHYFRYGTRIVWHKELRVDRIFGSTGGQVLDVLGGEIDSQEAEVNEIMPSVADAERPDGDGRVPAINGDEVVDADLPLLDTTPTTAPPPALQDEVGGEMRPNSFFCLHVDDVCCVEAANTLQQAVVAADPRLRPALTPISALHVTLATALIATEAARLTASQILSRLSLR